MKTLYGGDSKPHHLCCNYSSARINQPCSQCDGLYRAAEFTPEEQLARLAANTIKLTEPNAEITYSQMRDFLVTHGYEARLVKTYHGDADIERVSSMLFHNPSHKHFLAMPTTMAENDVLDPVQVERFRKTILQNDPDWRPWA